MEGPSVTVSCVWQCLVCDSVLCVGVPCMRQSYVWKCLVWQCPVCGSVLSDSVLCVGASCVWQCLAYGSVMCVWEVPMPCVWKYLVCSTGTYMRAPYVWVFCVCDNGFMWFLLCASAISDQPLWHACHEFIPMTFWQNVFSCVAGITNLINTLDSREQDCLTQFIRLRLNALQNWIASLLLMRVEWSE